MTQSGNRGHRGKQKSAAPCRRQWYGEIERVGTVVHRLKVVSTFLISNQKVVLRKNERAARIIHEGNTLLQLLAKLTRCCYSIPQILDVTGPLT